MITRRGKPVAELVPAGGAGESSGVAKAREAARRIRERAVKLGGKFDWEEWKKYRDEGRR